jgi:hypothetical protein
MLRINIPGVANRMVTYGAYDVTKVTITLQWLLPIAESVNRIPSLPLLNVCG